MFRRAKQLVFVEEKIPDRKEVHRKSSRNLQDGLMQFSLWLRSDLHMHKRKVSKGEKNTRKECAEQLPKLTQGWK